jgi:hypothetical protein
VQLHTEVAVVVDEDDLVEQVGGRAVKDGVDRAQQRVQILVVEADDHGGGRQHLGLGWTALGAQWVARVRNLPVVAQLVADQHVEGMVLVALVAQPLLLGRVHHPDLIVQLFGLQLRQLRGYIV